MKTCIPITSSSVEGAVAFVSPCDHERLSAYGWRLASNGYAIRDVRTADGQRTTLGMHREVLGLTHGDPVQGDHINLNKLDNRRENLRYATHSGNQQNRCQEGNATYGERRTTSQYRGVSWDSTRGRWLAMGHLSGSRRNLGRFDNEEDAGLAAAMFRAEHMPYSTEPLLEAH